MCNVVSALFPSPDRTVKTLRALTNFLRKTQLLKRCARLRYVYCVLTESLLPLYLSTLLPICTVVTTVKVKYQYGKRYTVFIFGLCRQESQSKQHAYTYGKCWMRRLLEAGSSCVSDGGGVGCWLSHSTTM